MNPGSATEWVFAALGLGVLASPALQRCRSRRELVSGVRGLTPLADAGRGILASPIHIDHLLERIFQEASRIVDTTTLPLGLFVADKYCMFFWTRDGERLPKGRCVRSLRRA